MDPPPPRFDSPLRAVSGTTKQLQHTKHLQRPAQHQQQQQQTTQRRPQQQQQHTQRRGSSSRSRPPSAAAAADDPAPAEHPAQQRPAQQHQQQQHQQQTTGSPASFRSPPFASSLHCQKTEGVFQSPMPVRFYALCQVLEKNFKRSAGEMSAKCKNTRTFTATFFGISQVSYAG